MMTYLSLWGSLRSFFSQKNILYHYESVLQEDGKVQLVLDVLFAEKECSFCS